MSELPQRLTQLGPDIKLSNPFWAFSLAVYSRSNTQKLLLEMQDRFSINVNLILWAGWLETQQKYLESEQWLETEQAINPWVILTQKYRSQRRGLKAQIKTLNQHTCSDDRTIQCDASTVEALKTLRSQVMKLELLSEQYQQALLFRFTQHQTKPKGSNPSLSNLSTLLTQHWNLPFSYLHRILNCFG